MYRLCCWSRKIRNDHSKVVLVSYIHSLIVYGYASTQTVSCSEWDGTTIMVALRSDPRLYHCQIFFFGRAYSRALATRAHAGGFAMGNGLTNS